MGVCAMSPRKTRRIPPTGVTRPRYAKADTEAHQRVPLDAGASRRRDALTGSAHRVRAIRQAQTQMFAVVNGLVQQLGNMVVVQAVDDAAPGADAGHQAEVPQ
jgi:hypothetical protein